MPDDRCGLGRRRSVFTQQRGDAHDQIGIPIKRCVWACRLGKCLEAREARRIRALVQRHILRLVPNHCTETRDELLECRRAGAQRALTQERREAALESVCKCLGRARHARKTRAVNT